MHMNARRSIWVSILAIVVGVAVAGCQVQVSKEDMQAIAAWSTAMCACAKESGADAKKCAAALKKPPLDNTASWWQAGGTKYKLESIKEHGKIEIIGEMCQARI